MGIFLRSLDTLLFNNEDRRVARAEQERMKLAVVEVNHIDPQQEEPIRAILHMPQVADLIVCDPASVER